jgi:O-antigen/teichoic acid export membrane protein
VTSAAADFAQTRTPKGWRHAAVRFATVGDQVIVALTNFGLTLAVGRAFGAAELAAYGMGLSIALMVQGLQRHAVTIPLLLKPAVRVERRRGGVVAAQAIVLLIALAVTGVAFLIARAVGASYLAQSTLLASAVCLVVYLQLEFARAFLTKIGRAGVLVGGALFYGLAATALALAALMQWISFEAMLIALGSAMLLHSVAVLAIGRAFSLHGGVRALKADIKRYGGWAVAATATYAGYNHIPLLIVGAIAAPIHAAVFVAARSLLQPLQILLRGFDVVDKSAFAELSARPYSQRTARFTLKLAALYALIGAAIGVVVALGAEQWMTLAYGQKFSGYGGALLAWVPAYILLSVSTPLESLVYARKVFREYFAIRGLASVVAIAAAFPLSANYGGVGAIMACAIGWFVAVTGTGLLLMRRQARS